MNVGATLPNHLSCFIIVELILYGIFFFIS